MSAHIRNLKLKSLKIHCFRSVSQVVSNEKLDESGTSHILNYPRGHHVRQADKRDSRIYSDIIWHVRNPNSNSTQTQKQNLLYFRPVTMSIEDLPLLSPGNRSKNGREENMANTRTETAHLCDCWNNVVPAYQTRKDLDFIYHRQCSSDQLSFWDSRNHVGYTGSSDGSKPVENILAIFNSGTDPKCETVIRNEGKPNSIIFNQHNKFIHDDTVILPEEGKRTKIFHHKTEEENSATVLRTNMNYSVTDPSDWTLYYCFQGDGKGKEPKEEPVDRGRFPKGKPSLSTLDESRDYIENEVTDFLNPGALNYGMMRSLHYNDVIFVNNYWGKRKSTRGFYQYTCQLAMYRMAIKFRYTRYQMEVQSVHMDYDKGLVKVHWRAYCLGYLNMFNSKKFMPMRLKSYTEKGKSNDAVWIEGISTFYCGEDGRIYKHYLDRMVPEEKNFSVVKTMKQKVAIALGILPKPLAESRQNNFT